MATFQKLTDVAVAEAVSEQANVFIEDGGELKRVAKSQVGGAGSLADLKDVVYFHVTVPMPEMDMMPMSLDNSGVATADYVESGTVVTCNKTFDEVLSLILNHELKMITGVAWYENGWNQAQLMTYDWWLTSESSGGDKVFDNSADCIRFTGWTIGEAGDYDVNFDLYFYSDNSIEAEGFSGSGMPS